MAIRLTWGLGLKDCGFAEGDFESWTPSGKFDVIMFSECIGYAHAPGALVARFLPWLESDGTIVISHFRFGYWATHWKRVYQHARPFAATTVANEAGQIWDIKLLRPVP